MSYSTSDLYVVNSMVRDIKERCGNHEIDVFFDRSGIRGGETIPEIIRNKIRECDEFMILLSQHSLRRQWVMNELGAAWMVEKRIIAVTYNVSPKEMPDIIAQNKAFDLNEFKDYLTELADRVEKGTKG